MPSDLMSLLVPVWFLCGIIAAAIGSKKGEAAIGLIVGLIFGPLGILFVILSTGRHRKTCPLCMERIHRDAVVCPRCKRDLPKGS
jgi:hypothetical protein